MRSKQALLALLVLALFGCSTARKAPQPREPAPAHSPLVLAPPAPEVQGPPEEFGPQAPEGLPQPQPSTDTQLVSGPMPLEQKKIVLVLSPGMARGFAHVGALKALVKSKIPVAAVLTSEIGSVFGSIYAINGNANRLEWALAQMKDSSFINDSTLLPSGMKKQSSAERLRKALEKVLGQKNIQSAKIPLRVSVEDAKSGADLLLDRGDAVMAVQGAMAAPEYYPSVQFGDREVISAKKARPYLVREARNLNLGPVVVIDTAEEQTDRRELGDANVVIKPDLQGIGALDFGKRNDASFRGQKAMLEKIDDIKKMLGGT